MIITEREIDEYTRKIYQDNGNDIIGKHSPINGEKDFVLCMIEQVLGLLDREKINDARVITYTQSMISVSKEEMKEYRVFLDMIYNDPEIRDRAVNGKQLTSYERKLLHEIMLSNLGEYFVKSDDQLCCYTAMRAFLVGLLCMLIRGIDFNIEHVDLIADLDDELKAIHIYESTNDNDFIIIQWHSTNKINNMYTLYKTQYSGLEAESILDLVSADVIEEDYYLKDERFTIAPSILMKQYLSIIEREVNIIIKLSGFGNPDGAHLMWYDMKNCVRKKGIKIDSLPFKLYKALDALYHYRNGTMHGEINITSKDYEILRKYKRDGLFKGLSIKKLDLYGKTLHPTVDEIGKYMGID